MLNFLQNSLQNNYISEDWILKNIDLKRIKWHEFARLVYFFTHHLRTEVSRSLIVFCTLLKNKTKPNRFLDNLEKQIWPVCKFNFVNLL